MIQERANLRRMMADTKEVLKSRKLNESLMKDQLKNAEERLVSVQQGQLEIEGSQAVYSESVIKAYVEQKKSDLKNERKWIRQSQNQLKVMKEEEARLTAEINRQGLDNMKLF